MTALMIGTLLAGGLAVFSTRVGLDRDRAYYPVVAIVVASYYILFAVMGASTGTLILEVLIFAVFLSLAVAGFKSSLWFALVALAGHGIFDLSRGPFISNPGMPEWWPEWCFAFDVVLGGYFAWQIKSGKITARNVNS